SAPRRHPFPTRRSSDLGEIVNISIWGGAPATSGPTETHPERNRPDRHQQRQLPPVTVYHVLFQSASLMFPNRWKQKTVEYAYNSRSLQSPIWTKTPPSSCSKFL